MRIMKIIEIHLRIMTKTEKQKSIIPLKNYRNHEIHRIPYENLENHENLKIPCQNHENK